MTEAEYKAEIERMRGQLEAARGLLAQQADALSKLGQHHRECADDRDRRIDELQAQYEQARVELEALKKEYDEEVISHDIEEAGLKEKVEALRVDLAACERKLAAAENAAKYWEEKARD